MNPYQKYKSQSVESMSQGELLIMVYDEAIKDMKRAGMALDDKDYDEYEKQLNYFTKIIRYLVNTLDLNQPISMELRRIYDYIQFDVGRLLAGRERRKDEIPQIIEIISNLRDGFEEASRRSTAAHFIQENTVVV
jgi:flagellar protein FliS